MLSYLTAAVVVYVTYKYLQYRKNLAKVGGMPGYQQLIMPGSLLFMTRLIPEKIFGIPIFKYRFDLNWRYQHKDLFAPFKQDVLSFISPDEAMVMVADAAWTRKITANRTKFPKPVEYYSVLDIFGSNVVTVEGDLWRKHRKVASPSFSENNNRLVHEITMKHTLSMFEAWHKESGSSEKAAVRVDHDMIKLALYIISGAGFGIDLTWEKNDIVPKGHQLAFARALEIVTSNTHLRVALPKFVFKNLKHPRLQEVDLGFEEFDSYIKEVVQGAKNRLLDPSSSSGDATTYLMQADLLTALVEASMVKDEHGKWTLNDSELNGNIFIFLMAGHETTAHTLIYALSLLALHPEYQEKLHKEVTDAIGQNLPSYDDFQKLHYTLCVFNEALRLFPPVVYIPKKFGEDTIVNDFMVKKGTQINLHVPALHRNPKYWGDDADSFRPDRFDTRENPNAYEKDAFIPFSEGMRSCLGKRFAQVEAVCVLAMISQKYQISLADENDRRKILESRSVLTLTPVNPVRLEMIRRK
jgi:cytochrome P450